MTEERSPLRIVWDGHLRSEWDRLADAAPACPFEQSWIYGEAYARHDGEAVRRGIAFDGEAPLALVQAFTRRFGSLVTLVQILRGPVLLTSDAAPDTVAALYRRIKTEIRRPGREIHGGAGGATGGFGDVAFGRGEQGQRGQADYCGQFRFHIFILVVSFSAEGSRRHGP